MGVIAKLRLCILLIAQVAPLGTEKKERERQQPYGNTRLFFFFFFPSVFFWENFFLTLRLIDECGFMRVCNEGIFLSLARRVLVVLARDIKANYPIAKYRRFEVKKKKKKHPHQMATLEGVIGSPKKKKKRLKSSAQIPIKKMAELLALLGFCRQPFLNDSCFWTFCSPITRRSRVQYMVKKTSDKSTLNKRRP